MADIYSLIARTRATAIKCPHCGSIQPPTNSTCTACGREFDWEEAYQLYLSHRGEDTKMG